MRVPRGGDMGRGNLRRREQGVQRQGGRKECVVSGEQLMIGFLLCSAQRTEVEVVRKGELESQLDIPRMPD